MHFSDNSLPQDVDVKKAGPLLTLPFKKQALLSYNVENATCIMELRVPPESGCTQQ
jgi:hypothetical protein